MYMQNKDYDEIFDIFAVRIIVDSVIDCYNCLGIIHEMFHPLPNRFKDYIRRTYKNKLVALGLFGVGIVSTILSGGDGTAMLFLGMIGLSSFFDKGDIKD